MVVKRLLRLCSLPGRSPSPHRTPWLVQEEKVEREVSAFRNHLQFEVLLGRSPPLNDTELQATLRKKALDLEREERERNCVSLANFVTDSTFAIILSANLLLQLDEAEKLRKTLSKQFFSLDSSRQAFILLLVSDILVGYHSAEGWSTGLEGIGHHYGLDVRAHAPQPVDGVSPQRTAQPRMLCPELGKLRVSIAGAEGPYCDLRGRCACGDGCAFQVLGVQGAPRCPLCCFVLSPVTPSSHASGTPESCVRDAVPPQARGLTCPLPRFSLPQYLRNFSPDTQVILEEIDRH